MKYLLLLLSVSCLNAQGMFDGRAGDVWHLTGSTLGVLAIQKTFETKWETAAVTMFGLGVAWELADEFYGKGRSPKGIFDPTGFSWNDLFYDMVGVFISYPLKYEFKISKNRISLRIPL